MAQQWLVSLTVRDAKDQKSVIPVYVQSPDVIADPADDPAEWAQELATRMDDLIDGQIVAIAAARVVELPAGLKAAPNPNSDVEEGMTFYWNTAISAPSHVRIPTWREDLAEIDGSASDTVDVANFSLMFTGPEELPANWSVDPTDSRGSSIVARIRTKETFRRSRR